MSAALGGLLGATRDAEGRPILPPAQLADMTGGLRGRDGDGALRDRGLADRLSETPVKTHRPVPGLGQHTEEVLRESGYGSQEIGSLREGGVIR